MSNEAWEAIYTSGQQLNRHPFSEVVSFFYRNRPALGSGRLSALDVGCGSGVHSDFLAGHGFQVLGIDFSAAAIAAARETYPSADITFRVADFDAFDPGSAAFDMVIDRCATTHSSVPTAESFYQNLRSALNPGARLFWQGFAWDNSGRPLGRELGDGSWSDFSGGVFRALGRTAFFTEEDVARVFEGYRINSFRHLTDRDMETGYEHTSWIVEAGYDG